MRGSARNFGRALAAAALPGIAIFALYWMTFELSGGKYLGLCDMRGWNLYARVAPFADCQKFSPPHGTAILCEQRSVSERPGPFGYVWDLNSIARRSFELGPTTGQKLEAFAWQAIIHQPADYIHAVLIDLARYIEPSIGGAAAYGGQPREILALQKTFSLTMRKTKIICTLGPATEKPETLRRLAQAGRGCFSH